MNVLITIKTSLSLLLICITTSFYSQGYVLDSPFIYEEESVFRTRPTELNYLDYNRRMILNQEQKTDLKIFENQSPVYPQSYLYSEPEYARVRVTRTINIKNNEHLSNEVSTSYWVENKNEWDIYSDTSKLKKLEFDKKPIFNTQLPYFLKRYIGVNVVKLKNDTSIYARGKYSYLDVENSLMKHIEEGYLKLDKNGVLKMGKPFTPSKFEIISFQEIINSALKNNNVPAYRNTNFNVKYLSEQEVDTIINQTDFNIKGYRIKEDYYIDYLSGELKSMIMWIGLVGDDDRLGEELLWLYYPAMRWKMGNKSTISNGEIINYEHLFDAHLNNFKIESYERLTSNTSFKTDLQFSVKLDALIAVQLQSEIIRKVKNGESILKSERGVETLKVNFINGLANGNIIQYYDNGKISFKGNMEDGFCKGEFLYYYPSGKLKAKRNFEKKKPKGNQFNYYEDGNLYAKYTIAEEEIIQSLERYYPNRKLIEKGKFKNGIVFGKWKYRIECSPEIFEIIDKNDPRTGPYNYAYINGGFNFSVSYNHIYENDCPVNYFGSKYHSMCLHIDFMKNSKVDD